MEHGCWGEFRPPPIFAQSKLLISVEMLHVEQFRCAEFLAREPVVLNLFHVEQFHCGKPVPIPRQSTAIQAEYNSLVPALESGIAKPPDSNYAALKSLGSP